MRIISIGEDILFENNNLPITTNFQWTKLHALRITEMLRGFEGF